MRLAWLCYTMDDTTGQEESPIILFSRPESWRFSRIVPIVYAVLA